MFNSWFTFKKVVCAILCARVCFSLQHVPGHPWRTVHDTAHSLFYPPDFGGVSISLPEKNRAVSDVSDGAATASSDDAGVVEGEVHFMAVPWSNSGGSERAKFKVSGVNTC
jgi:hypothetical protein